jgi:hypothetical protein
VISRTLGVRFLIERDSCFPLGGVALDAYEQTTRLLIFSIISWSLNDWTQVKVTRPDWLAACLNLTTPLVTSPTDGLGRRSQSPNSMPSPWRRPRISTD